jgi:hypothetical protein
VVDAEIYVVVDGDDTYPAEVAPQMVAELQNRRLDMLVGARLDRYQTGSFRAFHHFGNRIISGLVSLLFRTHLADVLSGYRVMSRACVKLVHLRQGGFEVETELTLQALTKRLAIAETPVAYRKRPEGSFSKLNTWSDGFLILKSIILLFKDYKPLLFFSTVAGLGRVCQVVEKIRCHHSEHSDRLISFITRPLSSSRSSSSSPASRPAFAS